MSLKDETMRCYFINRNDSPYFESDIFKNTLQYLANRHQQSKIEAGS
jgi:transcription-repair coupling factor (superfamily II helicase)